MCRNCPSGAKRTSWRVWLSLWSSRDPVRAPRRCRGRSAAGRWPVIPWGYRPRAMDGMLHTAWVVLDFFDVIVQVMRADVREHYDLEGLWGDAPRLRARRTARAKPQAD